MSEVRYRIPDYSGRVGDVRIVNRRQFKSWEYRQWRKLLGKVEPVGIMRAVAHVRKRVCQLRRLDAPAPILARERKTLQFLELWCEHGQEEARRVWLTTLEEQCQIR